MSKPWYEESPQEFADGFTETTGVHHVKEGTLIASSNRGRYAFDEEQGPPYSDITSGQLCAIRLAGQWVSGSVEHTHSLYADEVTGRVERGYYFIAEDGSRCGLCVGIRMRLP